MPGLQAGGPIPPSPNFKKPPIATSIFFSPIKLPMHPQEGGGAAIQTPLFDYSAKVSEISRLATALYGTVSPLLVTNMEEKTKFLSKTNDRIKCNTNIYLQNIIVLILFFCLLAGTNFLLFLEKKP